MDQTASARSAAKTVTSAGGDLNTTKAPRAKRQRVQKPQTEAPVFGSLKLAEVTAPRMAGRFRWCKELGWLHFDGAKWIPDAEVHVIREVQLTIKDYTQGLLDRATVLTREHLTELKELSNGAVQNHAVKILRGYPEILTVVADFDPQPKPGQPWLVPCANGITIELHADGTRKARATLHSDMNTHVACDYLPKAKAPKIGKAFKAYQPDDDVRRFQLQQWARGLSGIGSETFTANIGEGGGNGKGTMQGLLEAVAGDYAAELPVEVILRSRGGGSAREVYRSELAQLRGARLVFCDEPDQEARYNLGMLKKITGGGTLQGRAMGKEAVTFQPKILFQMAANNRPTWAQDGGMERRYIEVAWNFRVQKTAIQENFKEELKAERSGFLNRILENWTGSAPLVVPDVIKAQTEQGVKEASPVAGFVTDALEQTDGDLDTVSASMMYKAYEEWCRQNGRRAPVSSKVFGLEMPRAGYEKKRRTAGMLYTGVKVSEEYLGHM